MKGRLPRYIGAVLCVLGLYAGQAAAVPILYNDPPLANGVARAGVNNQTVGNQSSPIGAEYFRFFANAGSNVTVDGDRSAGHYDMSFWVFSGTFTDTNDFSGGSSSGFDISDPGFIALGDDQQDPAIPGNFGDPFTPFIAPVTGFYTVAVTNSLSSAGPPNPFTLTANSIVNDVPEPGTLLLVGVALAGLGFAARRRA